MPLGMEVGLGPGHILPERDPAVPPKRGTSAPYFRNLWTAAHVYCGQTAGWIRIPRGTVVGLGPADNVLDRDPALSKKGIQPPFWPMSVLSKRLDGSRCRLVRR